jgi:hypothetical protein
MTSVAGISDNTDKKSTANFKKTEAGISVPVSAKGPTKEQLKAEFKEALNDALDIVEGKKPRKTLKDILNG